MNQERKYVGSGKKVDNYDIVNITVDVDKVNENSYEYNGKKLANLTVASKREVDQYGKSHTVYVREKVEKKDNNSNQNNQTESVKMGTGLPF